MRSRDGDRPFSRSICALTILLFSHALSASEYLISYRYVVKDALLYNEHLDISPAMRKCSGIPQNSILFESNNSENLSHILSANKEQFLDFLQQLDLEVLHTGKTTNMQNSSTTVITMRSRCFKVDFNDSFVKISPLK